MGRIFAISSQVVRGHVGLSAIVPALQRLGHEVLSIPTIILSNHPGHVRAAGMRVEVNTLMSMLDVLDANGWLADMDAVLTGYLPTPEHVYFARLAIDLVRSRSAKPIVLVDPVLGDDPRGLYIDPAAAQSIRDDLLPRADIVTPNRFELAWLTGCPVHSVVDAVAAARSIKPEHVLATSIPDGVDQIANTIVQHDRVTLCRVTRIAKVPHGTGDLLSALLIGHMMKSTATADALGSAVAGLQMAIAASLGQSDLNLTIRDAATDWANPTPMRVEVLLQ
jgi:pyridoxine kinase